MTSKCYLPVICDIITHRFFMCISARGDCHVAKVRACVGERVCGASVKIVWLVSLLFPRVTRSPSPVGEFAKGKSGRFACKVFFIFCLSLFLLWLSTFFKTF